VWLEGEHMAKIVITNKGGQTVEISDVQLTVQEIKELAGLNGHGRGADANVVRRVRRFPRIEENPNYEAFGEALSDKGRKFVEVLRQHPNGISADELAEKLGLHSAVQIGGVTGGGLSKLAGRFNVGLNTIYIVEKRFENGTRRTLFRPGKNIEKV
jgi:hypothetical protein